MAKSMRNRFTPDSWNIPKAGSRNVLFVATEHDSVYAFDADTGKEFWQVRLVGFGETTSDNRGCSQVIPEIGITSTPVIDLHRGAARHDLTIRARCRVSRWTGREMALFGPPKIRNRRAWRDYFGEGNKFITPMIAHGKV
jgi:hypothetical protein